MNTNTILSKELLDLSIYAFHKKRTPERERAFSALLNFSTPYTHRSASALTSMVIDSHFEVHWGGKRVKMSGVGYVASYPEYRGNGAIRGLMTELLRDNYEAGTVFSYLAPFSYEFYGKFGYHYAFEQKLYRLPAQDFPQGRRTIGRVSREQISSKEHATDGAVSPLMSSSETLTDLMKIHESAYNKGSLARSVEQWHYYFEYKSQPYFAVYREEGKALGYLIYEFSGMDFVIRELITLTDEAKQGLYRFIASHAGAFSEVVWQAPSDATLEQDMREPQHAKISLLPYMQARIVNLDAFLESYGPPDFPVEIIDEILPENHRIFGEGQPEKMSIGEFTAKILRKEQAILREYF